MIFLSLGKKNQCFGGNVKNIITNNIYPGPVVYTISIITNNAIAVFLMSGRKFGMQWFCESKVGTLFVVTCIFEGSGCVQYKSTKF